MFEWNIAKYPQFKETVKAMLTSIRSDEFEDDLIHTVNRDIGKDILCNTHLMYLGHTVDVDNNYFVVAVGYNPVYANDTFMAIVIEKDITKSRMVTGYARQNYATGLMITVKEYTDMQRGKYKEYIETWHKALCEIKL